MCSSNDNESSTGTETSNVIGTASETSTINQPISNGGPVLSGTTERGNNTYLLILLMWKIRLTRTSFNFL